METEYIKCKKCGRVGQNIVEEDVPVTGHPNVTEKWLICKCGEAIMEITE